MWLVDLDGIWDGQPEDDVRGVELALQLMERTRSLLGSGESWQMKPLATNSDGTMVDPLSAEACCYSLSGAAARARWELRDKMADAAVNPVHVRQIMDALFALARTYRGERQGWMMVEAVLDGMQSALDQYRDMRSLKLLHETVMHPA